MNCWVINMFPCWNQCTKQLSDDFGPARWNHSALQNVGKTFINHQFSGNGNGTGLYYLSMVIWKMVYFNHNPLAMAEILGLQSTASWTPKVKRWHLGWESYDDGSKPIIPYFERMNIHFQSTVVFTRVPAFSLIPIICIHKYVDKNM